MEGMLYIISDGRQTFIIGFDGIALCADIENRYWEEYIRYVRNWTAVSREKPADVPDDVAGPMQYSIWKIKRGY